MQFLHSIFEIGKSTWEATQKWVGYINCLDANMKNLKRKIEYLSSQENDINKEMSIAEQRSRKRRKKEVEVWQKDVQRIKGDVQTLQMQEQEIVGWKNVFSRIRLGKLVVEKIKEVAEVQEKGRLSNDLLIDAFPNSAQFIPTTGSLGEITSARNMEKVWEYLMDDEVRRIGIYGMGGVGKTTIMHHINNRLLNETCNFSDVIWVTLSKAFTVRNLQRQITEALDLDLSNYGDETRRASEIYTMLSQKKRHVLILDDLWETFPLEKVGIPEPTRFNGCKLVLTTRSLEVCRKMECKTVKVELLTEEEALNLFMSKIEENQTVLTPKVKEFATEVAKECARLPLAIVTIAGSMMGVNDIHEWRNALNELISSTKQIRDNESEVFERLKFSYSRLNDEKLQHCFLYCALYPEDYKIPRKELIEYWIAEGLITEKNSIQAMFDEGHTILNKLVNSCLLENLTNIYKVECVRMHDLIRDMALNITSTSPRFMVRAGEALERVPYEDWSEDLERVSLMFNRTEELPSRPPICPQLTTLLLRENSSPILLQILDSFFMHMHRLKVLDLSFIGIQSLPESISKLENLHALLLEYCWQLEYVPSLEKLKALKELKLTESQIEEVPQGLEELSNLRNLDLSQNYRLHTFPSWKLCRLSQLQCLRINRTKVKVSAEELLCLTQLKVLGAQFHNVQELTSYMTSQQCQSLENYHVMVGIVYRNDRDDIQEDYFVESKEICIYDSKRFRSTGVDLLVLPSNIEILEIRRCHHLISLMDIQSLRDARDLRICEIRDCNGIESIFSLSSFSEDYYTPLRMVEELWFSDLPNFRVLFDGVIPPCNISFNLKELYFYRCPRIKIIFPAKFLQKFPNLEELVVCDCETVEDIMMEAERSDWGNRQDNSNTVILPNFKNLKLENLPRLKSIYKGMMVCESLRHVYVSKCPMVRRLPLFLHMDSEQVSAPPALRSIGGEEEWWESLEWDDPRTKTTLQPLFFRIQGS